MPTIKQNRKRGIASQKRGYKGELLVKKKLWKFGYSVVHQPHPSPFDLLVDNEIRLEVKTSMMKTRKNKTYYWHFGNIGKFEKHDIVALVRLFTEKQYDVLFIKKDVLFELCGGKTNILITDKFIEEHKNVVFTSPYQVLGRPKKLSTVKL